MRCSKWSQPQQGCGKKKRGTQQPRAGNAGKKRSKLDRQQTRALIIARRTGVEVERLQAVRVGGVERQSAGEDVEAEGGQSAV